MSFIVDEDIWPPKDSMPFRMSKKKKSMHGNEASLSRVIIEKLNEHPHVKCQKCHGSAYGMPTLDIFGSNLGRFFWLEVKQPGEKPTKRQCKTMKDWIKKGAIASWTDSVKGAMSFIEQDWSLLTEAKMLEGFHAD